MPPKLKLFQPEWSKQIYNFGYFSKNSWIKHQNSVHYIEISYFTCLEILGISRNAKVNQIFCEMPGIFRHLAKFPDYIVCV